MTLLSIFQDFKMTSSSYLLGNVVSFFNGLWNLFSCRVGPGAPVLADVFLWLCCLSVLSGQCLLLRTSCCPTDVPFHSVQTDSCSLTKSPHHPVYPLCILELAVPETVYPQGLTRESRVVFCEVARWHRLPNFYTASEPFCSLSWKT